MRGCDRKQTPSRGGLGSAIACSLAREGVNVVAADLDLDAAKVTTGKILTMNRRALAMEWDLKDLAIIDDHIGKIEHELGPVDILINNTGGPLPSSVYVSTAAVWQEYFQSMVVSVISKTNRVLPNMRQRRRWRDITSTSSGVVAPIPNLAISNALRLSLVGWSKTLAREVGGDRVTVNVTVPCRIATPRITFLDEQKAKRDGRDINAVSRESTASIAVARYGDPQEYADGVVSLTSAPASYVTGTIFRIDGGMISSI